LGSLSVVIPWNKFFLRVTYLNKVLEVDIAVTVDKVPLFSPCFEAVVDLGLDNFFGVTAANGRGVATFDVVRWETHSLAAKSEDMTQARRDSYSRETQKNHEQNPTFNTDLPTPEFRHHILTTLQQMQGALSAMALVQSQMEQLLAKGAAQDEHRMHFDRIAGGAVDAELVKSQVAKIASAQSIMLRDLQTVQPQSGVEDTAQIVRSKQRQVSNLLQSLQVAQFQQPASNANPSVALEFEALLQQQSWKFVDDLRLPPQSAPAAQESRLIPIILFLAVLCSSASLIRTALQTPKHTSHY